MDLVLRFLVWCIVILAPALVLLRQRMKSKSKQLPPGPPGWPVFGNMFQLGAMPHKTIASLRKEYGPVVWFRIGSINTMAVLTAKAATELFKNHDITFVERTITYFPLVAGGVFSRFRNHQQHHRVGDGRAQAVVKETLRLHPPIPFLVPRKATQDTDFMGYHIPKNTQVFVNAWAIGRDSECWDEPSSFKPERFLGSKIDYKGQHFELIPFGAGRRICAGIPLAHRMLHLALGSLLHEFDWEIDEIARNDIMDTRERIGVTVRKLLPLNAIPIRCMI